MDNILKVVIADDEALALNGIAGIVDSLEGFTVAGKAFNGEQALNLIQQHDADILLTDIKMPNTDGMWLIDKIEKLSINVSIIVISAYDDQMYLKSAIRNPYVFDYIFKPFMANEIVELLDVTRNYHNKVRNKALNEDINLNLIVNCITSDNLETLNQDLNIYFQNYSGSLQSAKDKAYGWIMFIYNSVFIDRPSLRKMHETDIMNEIYRCESLTGLKNVISQYLAECCSRYVRNEEVTPLISSSLQIISQELDNCDLNLNYIAHKLDVTPNYLSGKFSRDMKQSFSNYLTHLRINVAKELLNDVSKKVYEVSLAVGFSDVSYFNKVFKEHTGLTPLQYRQQAININVSNYESTVDGNEIDEMKSALLANRKKYPYLQPEDAVLLIYQSEFGTGREIKDPQQSLKELQEEYGSVSHGFGSAYEDIGGGLIRVNLNNLDTRLCPLEHLNQMYVETSKKVKGDSDRFIEKLNVLREITREGLMPFNSQKLETYLNEYGKAGYPLIDHSEILQEYYHPSYRVVLKRLCAFLQN